MTTPKLYLALPNVSQGLPVLIDIQWLGQLQTSEDLGIVASRSAHSNHIESDDSLIL